jgi:hypothetical protein
MFLRVLKCKLIFLPSLVVRANSLFGGVVVTELFSPFAIMILCSSLVSFFSMVALFFNSSFASFE